MKSTYLVAATYLVCARAQSTTFFTAQNDTWNSSFTLPTNDIVTTANLSDVDINNLDVAINFERSNWATGDTSSDDFYANPNDTSSLKPGTLLRVEPYVNTSTYTLPPNTALSRISFTTRNPRNETIPASAYVLWPYMPLSYPNLTAPNSSIESAKYPVVAFAHGTSGVFAECGPSHLRNLWYAYSMPYELALSGYVVVAPDYQGLGINQTSDGTPIYHPYLDGPAAADDLFYAIQAAQSAFPDKLSHEFIITGHSQGGNAAWASAIRQAQTPVDGHLGTVAGSPVTNLTILFTLLGNAVPPNIALYTANSVKALYPDFNQSRILNEEGAARLQLASEISMCNSAIDALIEDLPASDPGLITHPNWTTLPEIRDFIRISDIGNQKIAGPMLVLQGTGDPTVPYQSTDASVELTCQVNDGVGIEYYRFANVTHVPVLFASRRIWLDFLSERFSSVGTNDQNAVGACRTTNVSSTPWPSVNYQAELNYFLELATQAYEVA